MVGVAVRPVTCDGTSDAIALASVPGLPTPYML